MVRRSVQAVLTAALVLAPLGALQAAQDRSQDSKGSTVPESAMPPAGMCRVWLRDVPERQQPAPTDCATAIRTMPRDAMVLFGDLKRSARVSPNARTVPARPSGARPARELPSYSGPGIMSGEARGEQSPARRSGVSGVSATAPGAAAVKAPEAKAVIKPEKPQ